MGAENISSGFNESANGDVFARNLKADVIDEPLLIKVDLNPDGSKRYLVHEDNDMTAIATDPLGEGKLKSYSEADYNAKYADQNVRTLQEYKSDLKVLNTTPGLGSDLDANRDYMNQRVEEVDADMKTAGESFEPYVPSDVYKDIKPVY